MGVRFAKEYPRYMIIYESDCSCQSVCLPVCLRLHARLNVRMYGFNEEYISIAELEKTEPL